MNKNKILFSSFNLLCLLVGLFGCATDKINTHPGAEKTRIFPNGVYYHVVTLEIKPNSDEAKKYTFDGIVRMNEDQIIIVALSFFGTTEFKISEDMKTGQVDSEIYREGLKKFEPQLKSLYSTLRLVLLAKMNEAGDTLHWQKRNAEGLPLQMTSSQNGIPLIFDFSGYDQNKIPEEIKMSHPQFKVRVRIKRYEI